MKTNRMHRTLAALTVATASLAGLAGCSTTPAGNGTAEISWNRITGRLSTTVDGNLDKAHNAAVAASGDMQYTIVEQSKDVLKGIVKTKADKSGINVVLDKRTENSTDVTVDVGPAGSETAARTFLEKIRARL
jgi:hypothetical protein